MTTCAFPSYVFLKIMYYQSDETCILKILAIKVLFTAQPWWADL